MKLTDIQESWAKDSVIDITNISGELIKIPRLHSKYFNILNVEKTRYQDLQNQYKELYLDRWKFYNKMGQPEDYDKYERDDFFDRKFLKEDKKLFIEADTELLSFQSRIALQKDKIDFLLSVLKMVQDRTFHIKNYIEWRKFESGER